MKIEHIAVIVKDPVAVAQWYSQNLGLRIVRSGGAPTFTTFLADEGNHVMIEMYTNPSVPVPDYGSMDPLILHLAFVSHDMQGRPCAIAGRGCHPPPAISA